MVKMWRRVVNQSLGVRRSRCPVSQHARVAGSPSVDRRMAAADMMMRGEELRQLYYATFTPDSSPCDWGVFEFEHPLVASFRSLPRRLDPEQQ